jgi:hypothetical protein
MEYADYVRQIKFRLFQPDSSSPAGFQALSRLSRKAGIDLETWITALPDEQEQMQRRLRRICRLRHRSTFAIGALINRGVAQLQPGQAFLCVGVGEGFPLFAAMAGHRRTTCVGVDSFSRHPASREQFLDRFDRWRSPHHAFYQRDFREYLTRIHQRPLGFCTFHGLRTYDDQFDALRLCEPFVAEGGLILVNDLNRVEIRRAAHDFLASATCRYHVLLEVETPRSGHPTFWNGVLLLARGERKALLIPPQAEERRAA